MERSKKSFRAHKTKSSNFFTCNNARLGWLAEEARRKSFHLARFFFVHLGSWINYLDALWMCEWEFRLQITSSIIYLELSSLFSSPKPKLFRFVLRKHSLRSPSCAYFCLNLNFAFFLCWADGKSRKSFHSFFHANFSPQCIMHFVKKFVYKFVQLLISHSVWKTVLKLSEVLQF